MRTKAIFSVFGRKLALSEMAAVASNMVSVTTSPIGNPEMISIRASLWKTFTSFFC